MVWMYVCVCVQIEAVATCNRDPIAVATAELMKLNHMPTGTEVKTGKIDADGLVKKLKASLPVTSTDTPDTRPHACLRASLPLCVLRV